MFKSDFPSCVKLCHVLGKCHVMYVKDFIKQTVEVREISIILHNSSHQSQWRIPPINSGLMLCFFFLNVETLCGTAVLAKCD